MDPSLKSEITQQPSGHELGEEKKQEIKDDIFDAAMKNKWAEVSLLYIEHKFLLETKLTKSEDTALHLAISSYHPDSDTSLHHPHLICIKKMVAHILKEKQECILKQKNEKGNTPLHLAAELGSVPIIECLVKSTETELISVTNSKGETPLFITAYRGKRDAFLYLHKCCQNEKGEGPIELCRREDGDNILHAAISGEYFELAFQIIHYYQPLVNRYNTQGMSPLHTLSRMPQVFKSGNHFRFIDSIIYYCTTIKELEKKIYKAEEIKDTDHKLIKGYLPENYETLADFLELLRKGTRKFLDTAGVTYVNQETEPQDQDHQNRHNDPENPPTQVTIGVTNNNQDSPILLESPNTTGVTNDNQDIPILLESPAEGKRNRKLFPDNYFIFIEFLKCLMKIVLLVLGIGLGRIKKLKERKSKHIWGVQIMELMIAEEKRYKFYKNTGEKPEDKGLYNQDRYKQIGAPPTAPPEIVDDDKKEDAHSNTAATKQSQTSSTDEKKTDDTKSELPTTKETPLLEASKMGIVEMVKKILESFPIAIQDTDSEEKNILLLAVEHRQTEVYNWLIGEKYPEYVFYQVDKHGNNAVHLTAKYHNLEVWRIPGKALQLQGERKWYKYVKHTLPQSYVRYNNKGQTPRQIFEETHAELLKDGTEWLVKTAESFSVVAALIATVAFATSATIPGGADDKGHPHLENQPAFDVFSIASLVSLCLSVTALVFFLAILTSRCQHNDFEKDLPRKLLLGLTSLFASITAILVSFCAAHFFVLQDKFKTAAFPIYGATCIPVVFFAFNQFPLYVDLIRSYIQKLPLRSYKVFYTNSSEATSSDQKKECKEDD